ncbi:hypothetical protein C6P52_13145 [Enterococcus mundtii]|uniref:Uncharacterized protein n=1 Tax=Enterococcus mundtii TaxID=53346 RepID=A0A2S7RXV5_ENTMU|nr:hypothetical protein CUS89_02540 [Enterococcus mundtii]PTO36975.1 hypothetical protein C6P52_13145 [Enterococcus mundtii]PTO43429.1 hypothetical protein C6P54_10170 [Enterococcus mundtii]
MAYLLLVKKPYIKQAQPTHPKFLMDVATVAKTAITVDFQGIARLSLVLSLFLQRTFFIHKIDRVCKFTNYMR